MGHLAFLFYLFTFCQHFYTYVLLSISAIVSRLLFADDTLIFCETDLNSSAILSVYYCVLKLYLILDGSNRGGC